MLAVVRIGWPYVDLQKRAGKAMVKTGKKKKKKKKKKKRKRKEKPGEKGDRLEGGSN